MTPFTTRTAIATVFLLMLSACATTPRQARTDKDAAWQRQQQQLGGLAVWELAGRMAVKLESEGWSASLYWWQDHADYRLRIVAPLGRGTIEIAGDGEKVTLHTADNRVLEDGDIDALMQENLGWRVPVDALIYWIRGLPDPDASTDKLELDDQGRLIALDQSGWNVRYERYTNSGGHEVPARMTIEREQLQLRLNINRWTLPDAS